MCVILGEPAEVAAGLFLLAALLFTELQAAQWYARRSKEKTKEVVYVWFERSWPFIRVQGRR